MGNRHFWYNWGGTSPEVDALEIFLKGKTALDNLLIDEAYVVLIGGQTNPCIPGIGCSGWPSLGFGDTNTGLWRL